MMRLPAAFGAAFQLESTLINLLAVAGGAAVGGVGTGLLLRIAARYMMVRELPKPVVRWARVLGALAVGLAVWVWLFGTGGPHWGPGGGGSLFGGKGGEGEGRQETASVPPATGPTTAAAPTSPATTPAATTPRGETLRVVMLGGERVKGQRFYLPEGRDQPLTLEELEKAIADRQGQGRLRTIDIVIYENSVARGHPAVRDLEEWARQHGLKTAFAFLPGEGP